MITSSDVVVAQAAILASLCEPLVVRQVSLPRLGAGQVLGKVFTVVSAEVNSWRFAVGAGLDLCLPHLLGHEGFGIVLEVGSAAQKVKPGDEVRMRVELRARA